MSQIAAELNAKHLYRVLGMIPFPMRMEAAAPPDTAGGLPKSLKPRKALQTEVTFPLGNHTFVLSPWSNAEFVEATSKMIGPFEAVAITVEVEAATAMEAVQTIADDLEYLLDFTAFQLQHPMFCMSLDVLDITPPLHLDEERDVLCFPFPHGFAPAKFRRMILKGDIRAFECPVRPAAFGRRSKRSDAALRWYAKALAAPFEADQFSFFWIALEILCHEQSSAAQPQPYKAPCGHEIVKCSICDAPTARRIGGAELKLYLSEHLGVSQADARDLWQTRQMFHGNNDLTQGAVEALPRHVLVLRGAITVALKRALEYPPEAPPFVASVAPQVSAFWLGGRRRIVESDLVGAR